MALWPKLSKKDAHNDNSVQLKVFNLLQMRCATGGRCCRKNERVANYNWNKFMKAYAVSYMKWRFARFGCHLSVILVYQSLHNTWLGGCYKWVLSQMPTPSFWRTPSQKAISGHRSSLMQLCWDCFKDGSQQTLIPPCKSEAFRQWYRRKNDAPMGGSTRRNSNRVQHSTPIFAQATQKDCSTIVRSALSHR